MKSPFQYGTIVDKECFVNRVEELPKWQKNISGAFRIQNTSFPKKS